MPKKENKNSELESQSGKLLKFIIELKLIITFYKIRYKNFYFQMSKIRIKQTLLFLKT